MREAHPRERQVGITYYASDAAGTGGRLKDRPADFRVEEIEGIDFEPLDADRAAFPHLVVRATLSGWDTFAFARRLSREVGIHHEQVRWAGTKDKTAITTQLFSLDGVEPSALPGLPDVSIQPVGRLGRGLTFGDLVGNTFDIRVRDPTHPERHEAITRELEAFGRGAVTVPNYFGLQRFGSVRPVTHRVGLAILSGDWERAVMCYLGGPSDAERTETQAARAFVDDTKDWAAALERFPAYLDHERRMLHRLSEADSADEAAYRDALDALPRTLRQLFVHAAQSYVFNRIVSERLARGHPLTEAIEGDVVCFAASSDVLGAVPDPDRIQRVHAHRVETINRHINTGRAFVTAPLVGTETSYATGVPGEIERGVVDDVGITREAFELPRPFDSTGTRRAMAVSTTLAVDEDPFRFAFSLPSGSYATVLMREYLKGEPEALGS